MGKPVFNRDKRKQRNSNQIRWTIGKQENIRQYRRSQKVHRIKTMGLTSNLINSYGRNNNQSHFITLASQIIIVAVLKAIMFYLIVKTFHDKKLTISEPFNETVRQFIALIAWIALVS